MMGKIKKVATGEKPIVVIPIIIEVVQVQVQVAIIRIAVQVRHVAVVIRILPDSMCKILSIPLPFEAFAISGLYQ